MKKLSYMIVPASVLMTGCFAGSKEAKVDWNKSQIVIDAETTREVGGVSEMDRKRYFALGDDGVGFEKRMPEEIYDYLINDLGAAFGRGLGPVQWTAKTLKEDPKNPGYTDVSPLKDKKLPEPSAQFQKDLGKNLDVASHGNHNAYPVYMGQHFNEDSSYGGKPEWIPKNIDAAAKLAAAIMKYNYNDFNRPRFFEPLNEPHWRFFPDPQLAAWHMAVKKEVQKETPDVLVGGMCQSVSYFYRDNYQNFNGFKGFLKNTNCELDFYSFHSYDYFDWKDGDFRGRVQSGLALEGSLDLFQNYTMNTFGKEVDIVVSEHGGYVNAEPKGAYDGEKVAAEIAAKYFPEDTWENELKKRSVISFVHLSSIIANTMAFMDHPHTVQKSVPFLLPNTWGWDPKYYAGLFVPENYDKKSGKWVESPMLAFYKLFKDVDGRRVKVLSNDPDLQTRAFVDGSKMFLAVNNQSWRPETVSLNGIDAKKVTIRRLGRNADFTQYFTEETISTPSELVLNGREAVVVIADNGKEIKEKATVNELNCYGDKTMVPVKDAQFKINVPVDQKIEYASLRVGLGRKSDLGHDVVITLNGQKLNVPMEDCADRLNEGEYGTTKMVMLNPADLKAENEVTVSFPDGQPGFVGSAVIRVAVAK